MSRTGRLGLAVLLLTVGMAGCLADGETLEANVTQLPDDAVATVVDEDGEPVAFAQIALYDAEGQRLAMASADAEGLIAAEVIAAEAERVLVTAEGHEAWEGAVDELPERVVLPKLPGDGVEGAPSDALSFLEPIQLGSAYMADRPETCNVNNCGASEPVIELAGDGTIFVSGTCCVGGSPPIWYSTDDGNSFQLLRGDVLRDSYGIEGDFAIDEAGNLYFSDISVASGYLASWDAEQEHRWTVPLGPFVPPVDRPWIRAGPEDTAWFLYNQVTSTLLYESTDGGLTWTLAQSFPGALGAFERGPGLEELWVTADDKLWHSDDGAESFSEVAEIPRPSEDGNKFQSYDVPAVDEEGNVWIVYDWTNGTSEAYHVYAAPFVGGSFGEPVRISPEAGTHHLPWGTSGAEGTLALAWYGTLDDEAGPNEVAEDAEWELFSAVSVDADEEKPSFQLARGDPQPVHEGPMDRKLLDFLQVEIGPEGAVHIAYAQDREGQVDERTEYVRTSSGLDLAPEEYLNGP